VTLWFARDEFTDEERSILADHFTNIDGPVFALVNLPEVVKGALFARYSRTPKSIRRLFLDEFADIAAEGRMSDVGLARAEGIYERIFLEYGDDSVAQLGGVHLACEQASQLMTKVIEWGRLAGYLEQSTRYIAYDDKPGGRWRYAVPPEIDASPLRDRYVTVLDEMFETYARWVGPMQEYFRERFPKDPSDPEGVYRATIRAKACDTLRGMLPAATRSNVGMYAAGQSYEHLVMKMRAHPLAEIREYSDLVLEELRKVIPAFLTRVDVEGRGADWSRYFEDTRLATRRIADELVGGLKPEPRGLVTLTDFDPDAEIEMAAAALYPMTDLPDDQLLTAARAMDPEERARILAACVGDRANRRHKPGRAFERSAYRFDVLCDYGAFRDLQRHRMLTIEWQPLSTEHGFETADAVTDAGASEDWNRVMEMSAALAGELKDAGLDDAPQYAVAMAYRIRFVMQMSVREAIHLVELRSSPQGHPAYRAVAHEMHRLIREVAGHRAVADAMTFVDTSEVDLERLEAERRTEAKRRALEAK
jgi:thymidylate synthase ThyX